MDWPGLMRAGLAGLRLTPEQFWALTPAELALMLGVDPGTAPMSRTRLEALARLWPDGNPIKENDDDGQERAGAGRGDAGPADGEIGGYGLGPHGRAWPDAEDDVADRA
ncbi:rcc01693 family protein [Paracoccus sediminicola]|uniref:rcc01693 family protein n=1 Tax=Paracoccus sediminicola TaxID=3017783 RepID=UPI003EBAFD8B